MKGDKVALAVLGMPPRGEHSSASEEDSDENAVHMAAQEMLAAIKANDGVALAEALKAAVMACQYEPMD